MNVSVSKLDIKTFLEIVHVLDSITILIIIRYKFSLTIFQ